MASGESIKGAAAVKCPACSSGNTSLVRQVASEEILGGRTIKYDKELTVCGNCEEPFYTPLQAMARSRNRAQAIREAQGLQSPEQIRSARAALNMTQEQFESALGVGRKTVVRWERGTVVPSSAANGLLWVAEKYPSIFLEYAATRGGDPREIGMAAELRLVGTTTYRLTGDARVTKQLEWPKPGPSRRAGKSPLHREELAV